MKVGIGIWLLMPVNRATSQNVRCVANNAFCRKKLIDLNLPKTVA